MKRIATIDIMDIKNSLVAEVSAMAQRGETVVIKCNGVIVGVMSPPGIWRTPNGK